MKRLFALLLTAALLAAGLTACGRDPDTYSDPCEGHESFAQAAEALEPDTGYTVVRLNDGQDYLLVSQLLCSAGDGGIGAVNAVVYGMRDGRTAQVGWVGLNDTAFPLRLKNGLLYEASPEGAGVCGIDPDSGLLFYSSYIARAEDEQGLPRYYGMRRTSCDPTEEGTAIDTASESEYRAFLRDYRAAGALHFAVTQAPAAA